jgi:hypothetical protein
LANVESTYVIDDREIPQDQFTVIATYGSTDGLKLLGDGNGNRCWILTDDTSLSYMLNQPDAPMCVTPSQAARRDAKIEEFEAMSNVEVQQKGPWQTRHDQDPQAAKVAARQACDTEIAGYKAEAEAETQRAAAANSNPGIAVYPRDYLAICSELQRELAGENMSQLLR